MSSDVCTLTIKTPRGIEHSLRLNLNDEFESDRNIRKILEAGKLYEIENTRIFSSILQAGDTVIDVGANIGWFTVLAAELVGPTGHVVAFEPSHANMEKIIYNVGLNGFKNVELVEGAVSDEVGKADFYLNPYGNGGHALWDMQKNKPDREASTVTQVAKFTLDQYFEKWAHRPPRIIKIDTEGHDSRVVAGAQKILEKWHPPFILSELHLAGMASFFDDQQTFRLLMKKHGYDTFILSAVNPLPAFIPQQTTIKTDWALNLLFASAEDIHQLCPHLEIYCYEETPT